MWVPRLAIAPVGGVAALYISLMRRHYRRRSTAIPLSRREPLRPFFSDETLDSARICDLQRETIPDPPFYPLLRAIGFRHLPSFQFMAAVTFQDVIVAQQEFSERLLFHELVHVVQYRRLGLDRFARLYVSGFVRGGGYEFIPLEMHAYALDERFTYAPQSPFSVEAEVGRWIAAGKY